MHVPSYQMHNVLNVYSKQLSRNTSLGQEKIQLKNKKNDKITISSEMKRKVTIEKIAKEILNKITCVDFQEKEIEQPASETDGGLENNDDADIQKRGQFVFNVIDKVNVKKMNAISVETTHFLVNRLEQLAKKDADNKGESE